MTADNDVVLKYQAEDMPWRISYIQIPDWKERERKPDTLLHSTVAEANKVYREFNMIDKEVAIKDSSFAVPTLK